MQGRPGVWHEPCPVNRGKVGGLAERDCWLDSNWIGIVLYLGIETADEGASQKNSQPVCQSVCDSGLASLESLSLGPAYINPELPILRRLRPQTLTG